MQPKQAIPHVASILCTVSRSQWRSRSVTPSRVIIPVRALHVRLRAPRSLGSLSY